MLVAALALVAARNRTGGPVCLADEPDGLLLLQSGLALVQPLRSRVVSLLQTSESEHAQASGDSEDSTSVDPGIQPGAKPPPGSAAPAGVGDRADTSRGSAVTIVMPPKASGEEIILATTKQHSS